MAGKRRAALRIEEMERLRLDGEADALARPRSKVARRPHRDVAAAVEGRGEDRLGAEELDRLHDGARAPIRRGERDVLGAKAEEDGALRCSGRR